MVNQVEEIKSEGERRQVFIGANRPLITCLPSYIILDFIWPGRNMRDGCVMSRRLAN